MSNLVAFEHEGALVVDSRLVARELGIGHESFIETIQNYQTIAEQEFGVFRFETGKPPTGSRGGRPEKYVKEVRMRLKKVKVTIRQKGNFQLDIDEIADCQRIVDAFAQNDLDISLDQSFILWQKTSAEFSSAWLFLPRTSVHLWAFLNIWRGELWD